MNVGTSSAASAASAIFAKIALRPRRPYLLAAAVFLLLCVITPCCSRRFFPSTSQHRTLLRFCL
jgi:hypothetical protein